VRAALLGKVDSKGIGDAILVGPLRATAVRLHARSYEPYPACAAVCDQDPPLCLYRSVTADLIASGRYDNAWYEADEADAGSEDKRRRETWELCRDAAYELIDLPDEDDEPEAQERLAAAARRVALCYGQQMLARDRRKVPRTAQRALERVLREAGL
jgi:hypothetical protein